MCRTKGLSGQSLKPLRWPITPEIHDKIKNAYHTITGNGEILDLARCLGYPRWKITRYAVQQGWIAKQKKEPNWMDKELEILERSAHLSPEVIQRHLKGAGFRRSAIAIQLKRKRMRFLQNLQGQSARMLSECLGVDVKFVTRAIQNGRLKAHRRGTERTPQQGGDIYYIKDSAIKTYILENLNEIDIRKVDKYWFVDILTN